MHAPPLKDKSAARSNFANAALSPCISGLLSNPGDNPQVIVIAHRPGGPSAKKNRLRLGDDLTERSGGKRALHEFKIVTAVQMLSCPGVLGADAYHFDIRNLADQITIVILVDDGAEFSQQLQSASLIPGIDQLLPIEWIIRSREGNW